MLCSSCGISLVLRKGALFSYYFYCNTATWPLVVLIKKDTIIGKILSSGGQQD